MAAKLEAALKTLEQVTIHLIGLSGKKGAEVFLADATLYLEMFGIIAVGWQWLLQATAARAALEANPKAAEQNFYQGKLVTARYFFAYELSKITSLAQRLNEDDPLTVEMHSNHFND
jgi:hypothetical protein